MKIHEKIRLMREANDWSQEEMAEKLNMSVNGYSKIERGETKSFSPKLEKIANLLGVDLLELISSQDKNVYLISDNNHGCNVIGSASEIAFEIQKLHLTISHQDEMIAQLKKENTRLEEIIALIKSKHVNS